MQRQKATQACLTVKQRRLRWIDWHCIGCSEDARNESCHVINLKNSQVSFVVF
jgi:hypothetical protein